MRSFAIAKNNVSNNDLNYWLNQNELYAPGLMKAAYGTFLTPLLVIYENDRVADESASNYNLTWKRISPVCVSLCNDYNCLYVTGESDHTMGREAIGDESNIWKFNFATSFAFSLNEHLVGSNVWKTSNIITVTLGLFKDYLNNESLDIFSSNGFIFIKNENSNNSLLIIELETGIVRDVFNYYGLLGTMPCYHDGITDNAVNYGKNLLDGSSEEYKDLKNVFGIGIFSSTVMEGVGFVLELGGVSLGLISVVTIPLAIIFFPEQSNEIWKGLMYMLNPNYKDYPDIPTNDGKDYVVPKVPTVLVLDGESLDDYIMSYFKGNKNPNPKRDKNYWGNHHRDLIIKKNYMIKIGSVPNGKDSNGTDDIKSAEEVGKYLKELYEGYKNAKTKGETIKFIMSHLKELLTFSLYIESKGVVEFLINLFLYELNKDNSNNNAGWIYVKK